MVPRFQVINDPIGGQMVFARDPTVIGRLERLSGVIREKERPNHPLRKHRSAVEERERLEGEEWARDTLDGQEQAGFRRDCLTGW